jgi:uncharacterized protein (AIM24 family)
MLDVKSIKDERGVVFLSAYGDIIKHTIKKGEIFNVRLGQLIAYESTVKVKNVNKIMFDGTDNQYKNPNKHGMPLNYYIEFKGEGTIYFQLLDYFDYSYNQLGMYDKTWLLKEKANVKKKN